MYLVSGLFWQLCSLLKFSFRNTTVLSRPAAEWALAGDDRDSIPIPIIWSRNNPILILIWSKFNFAFLVGWGIVRNNTDLNLKDFLTHLRLSSIIFVFVKLTANSSFPVLISDNDSANFFVALLSRFTKLLTKFYLMSDIPNFYVADLELSSQNFKILWLYCFNIKYENQRMSNDSFRHFIAY